MMRKEQKVDPFIKKELEKLKTEAMLKGYTQQTIKSYEIYIHLYLEYVKDHGYAIDVDSAKSYLAYLMHDRGYSSSSIAAIKAALIFYLKHVRGLQIPSDVIPTPKKDKKLPTVLNKDEVKRLINAFLNEKEEKKRLMIVMLYSTGLRVSELTRVKVGDIDFKEQILKVRAGKGKKDRIVVLGDKVLKFLKYYIAKHNLSADDYVFFSKHKRNKVSERYVQKVIKEAAEIAGINKDVTPHVLRHTFATHLLEQGENIRKIQELLGHSNLQTTQIYTKVSIDELKKVRNPLDSIDV